MSKPFLTPLKASLIIGDKLSPSSMVQSDRRTYLPPSTELPDSDDIPFELYKLIDNIYQLQLGEPFWMPEINLAIDRYQGTAGGIQQELLGWLDT
ncbi:hypothetical protein SPB21_10080 [Leptothoe sp. ISB3NOV94-8A]